MPVKFIKRNECDYQIVDEIVSQGDLPRPLVKLLVGRGIKTYDEAQKFLNPSVDDMCNPLEIYGMADAVKSIRKAIAENKNIVIYGDYDCDGLSAISILYLHLKNKVDNVQYYVPKRHAEGYGLHNIVIDDINLRWKPDLLITVDCGITSKAEVEYLKEMGIEVIVTDHHEPIEGLIPDCIVVDAKLNKSGFRDYCGAGLVIKLVEALVGRDRIVKYLGIAAIGTIADIVPLVGENRIIAKLGLDKINLLDTVTTSVMSRKLGLTNVTATDIMYKVAPRINALGRLGDASPIIDFFTSDYEVFVSQIVDTLETINKERQALCESTVNDILAKLADYDLKNNRIIVMSDKNWNIGVLGIAASKLADMFLRPVVLFSEEEDGLYRGSARSNSKINIFECLSYCADLFEAFGGHAAAAGVSIKAENFDIFREKINGYLCDNYPIENFYPDVVYDLKMSTDIDYKCVDTFGLLEPCGFGNPTPVFLIEKSDLRFKQIGNTQHIKSYYDNTELIAFNKLSLIETFNSECNLTFTLQNKKYKSRRYTQGVVKQCIMITPRNVNEQFVALNYLMHKILLPPEAIEVPIEKCKIEDIDLNDGIFGNLYVAFNVQTYYNFIKRARDAGGYLIANITNGNSFNPYNRIILCPMAQYDVRYYNNIYFLDKPINESLYGHYRAWTKSRIFEVGHEIVNLDIIREHRCNSVDEYRSVYKMLKANHFYGATTINELRCKLYELGSKAECIKVFSTVYIMVELGVLSVNDKGFEVVEGMHNTIENSVIYRYLRDL